MVKYEKPEIVKQAAKNFVENEASWFIIPAWAIGALGGAWAAGFADMSQRRHAPVFIFSLDG